MDGEEEQEMDRSDRKEERPQKEPTRNEQEEDNGMGCIRCDQYRVRLSMVVDRVELLMGAKATVGDIKERLGRWHEVTQQAVMVLKGGIKHGHECPITLGRRR